MSETTPKTNTAPEPDITLALEKLLINNGKLSNKIWRGSQLWQGSQHSQTTTQSLNTVDTGYPQLNQQLHSNGWPLATTTELGLSQSGIGELRLVIPALRKLTDNQQNILWVAPPFLPFAPALVKEKINVNKLVLIQPTTIQDTLWVTEQALLAQCCAAVFCWTGNYNLNTRELRRLQLATEKSSTWNIIFRHSDCLKQASTSGLRIHIKANNYSKLDLHIIKQPQGWAGQRCTLSLHPHYENWQRLPVNLLPQHNKQQSLFLLEKIKPINSDEHQQASVTVLTSISNLKTVH